MSESDFRRTLCNYSVIQYENFTVFSTITKEEISIFIYASTQKALCTLQELKHDTIWKTISIMMKAYY